MKLVELPKHKGKPKPNEYVIAVLKDLMKLAKAGEMQSLVAIFHGPTAEGTNRVGHIVAHPETNQDTMMIVATCEMVKMELLQSLWDSVDYSKVEGEESDEEDDDQQE